MLFTRRDFLSTILKAGYSLLPIAYWLLPKSAHAVGDGSKFVFAQIVYQGGNWNPRPNSGKRLIWELIKQTSIEARLDIATVRVDSPEIFEYPFLYVAGDQEFPPFSNAEIENLRRFLEFGGTMLVDDCLGKMQFGFDYSMRREIERLFPRAKLEKLPDTHSVYRSFYLVNQPVGRLMVNPYLEGINIDNRTVLIYSQNDLGGAWAKDNFGNWEYEVTPGGMTQRTMAFRLGINIILYALTGDYKQDQVHLPFILRRQM
ncbi:MAG TPA: DUF4159 domain-containing protein [Candidatus Brocadiales bacterium]|nr:DUF4159 domain-containing protein [Candidatus Brocadiales bacterium]